jgi:Ca2+-binding RTX toxin-like protein
VVAAAVLAAEFALAMNGTFTDTEETTLDGQDGNDTLLGGSGVETFIGGAGDDFADGNRGNDVAFMGAGDVREDGFDRSRARASLGCMATLTGGQTARA